MQTQIRHNPAFAAARLDLAPGEPARIESGAMMAHSAGVQLAANTGGGPMSGLKRSILSGGPSSAHRKPRRGLSAEGIGAVVTVGYWGA